MRYQYKQNTLITSALIAALLLLMNCQSPRARSDQYYETVAGHIIQTVLSGDCNSKCVSSIVNSDLKYATYAQAIAILDRVSKNLPNIFKGVKRELSIKIEEKYKKSVSE